MALVAAVLASALVATAGTSAAKTQQQRDRCAHKGSVTLISTKLVRIYRDRHTTFDATVYACHQPTGRATQLGLVLPQSLYQYGGVGATAVRGSTLVYGLKGDPEGDEGGPGYTIAVVKLPCCGQAVQDAPQFFADDTCSPTQPPTMHSRSSASSSHPTARSPTRPARPSTASPTAASGRSTTPASSRSHTTPPPGTTGRQSCSTAAPISTHAHYA